MFIFLCSTQQRWSGSMIQTASSSRGISMPISPHPRHLSSLPIVTVPQPIRRAQSLPTRSPIVTLRFSGSSSKIPTRGQKRPVRSTILKTSRSDSVVFVTVMNLVMRHQSQSVQSLHHQHDQRRNLQEEMLSSHHLGVHHRNPKVMSSLQRFLVITPEASAIRKYPKKAPIPKFFN